MALGSGQDRRLGADPTALDELARELAAASDWLRRSRWDRPVAGLHGLDRWHGPDADAVMARLSEASAARRAAGETLERCSAALRRTATEQRRASAAPPARTEVVDRPDDGGRLVQRVGDASAGTVVVLVPGVGTDRADGDRLMDDAVRVWTHLSAAVDDSRSVAVVSWLGYDPPDRLPGALDVASADEGAAALAAEVLALRRAGARRVVLVGHSFGGVVVGRSLIAGADVDVVVQLGSPGIGAPGVDSVAASRGVELRAARAVGDPIGAVAGRLEGLYGPDGIGLVPALETTGTGHGSYLHDDVVLSAVAEVAVGRGRSDSG